MARPDTLIRTYLFVCTHYRDRGLWTLVQRQSPNARPAFTDEEVLTVYLFALMYSHHTVKAIYDYVQAHFADWFPEMPSYAGYVYRLNRLHAVYAPLLEAALEEDGLEEDGLKASGPIADQLVLIIDSMPIVMAQQARSTRAKVAREVADKGYCASKNYFYHGVKLHAMARRREGTMPCPAYVSVTPASTNDLEALRALVGHAPQPHAPQPHAPQPHAPQPHAPQPHAAGSWLFGDKAYVDATLSQTLAQQDVLMLTPAKRVRGQERLSAADKLRSTAVSRVRQPIESLFNWINEKTGIQRASKVRSYRGLLVHVFGRLTAAMLLLAFNP